LDKAIHGLDKEGMGLYYHGEGLKRIHELKKGYDWKKNKADKGNSD
jgi:hypothetical protein